MPTDEQVPYIAFQGIPDTEQITEMSTKFGIDKALLTAITEVVVDIRNQEPIIVSKAYIMNMPAYTIGVIKDGQHADMFAVLIDERVSNMITGEKVVKAKGVVM